MRFLLSVVVALTALGVHAQSDSQECLRIYSGSEAQCLQLSPSIEKDIPGCIQNSRAATCSGRGQCVNDACVCSAGASGRFCQLGPCPNNCSNQGLCIHATDGTGHCLCLGSAQGEDCSQPTAQCPPGCGENGNGVCRANLAGEMWCECHPGFIGDACESRTCVACHHGVCNPQTFECECSDGWVGVSCSLRKCSEHNCFGHGYCVAVSPEAEQEQDQESFLAQLRQQLSNLFSGRGSSSSAGAGAGQPSPAASSSSSDSEAQAQAQAQATMSVCKCFPGFSGLECEITDSLCPNNCSAAVFHGRCTPTGCACESGFMGADCSELSCAPACLNGGVCVHSQCVCPSPFTGPLCAEQLCPNQCSGNGVCLGTQCSCLQGANTANSVNSAASPTLASSAKDLTSKWDAGYMGEDCGQRRCMTDCGASVKPTRGRCDYSTGLCQCNYPFIGLNGRDCAAVRCNLDCNGGAGAGGAGVVYAPPLPTPAPDSDYDDYLGVLDGEEGQHGVCMDNRCHCFPGDAKGFGGWSGDRCEIPLCPNSCGAPDFGDCWNGTCICTPPHTGPDCMLLVCPRAVDPVAAAAAFRARLHSKAALPAHGHGHAQGHAHARATGHKQHQQHQHDASAASLGPHEPSAAPSRLRQTPPQTHAAASSLLETVSQVVEVEAMAEEECAGHGRCLAQSGNCACDDGWGGKACNQRLCPANCNGHGACGLDGVCKCNEPFTGSDCSIDKTALLWHASSSMSGGTPSSSSGSVPTATATAATTATATDIADTGTGGATTTTAPGGGADDTWVATESSSALAPSTDVFGGGGGGGGMSGASGANDGGGGGGWDTGHVPIDGEEPDSPSWPAPPTPVVPTPSPSASGTHQPPAQTLPGCLNNCSVGLDVRRGVCSKQGFCLCLRGKYHGDDCSLVYCPNDCSGRGECDTATGSCSCWQGAGGSDCSLDWCVPANCSGRGECRSVGGQAVCVCRSPYSGPTCEQVTCDDTHNCGDHGVCREGTCFCDPGWRGAACDIEKCPNSCSRHGLCNLDTATTDGDALQEGCQCDTGFTSPDCSRAVCNGVVCPNSHSACSADAPSQCICEIGWTGPACGTALCPNGCSSHGVCQQEPTGAGAFVCQCDAGWAGADCSGRSHAPL